VLQDASYDLLYDRVPERQHETVVETINMNTPNIRINSNITSMMSPVVPRLIYAVERVY